MSDESQTPLAREAVAGPAAPAPRKAGFFGRLFRFLLWLLLFALVGYLALVILEQEKSITVLYNEYNRLSRDANAITAEMEAMREARAGMERELTAAREEAEGLREELAGQRREYRASLDSFAEALRNLRLGANSSASGANQQWLWGEAESLVRLARRQLQAARDVEAAIALLASARDLLARVAGPGAEAARVALERDLAALRNLPRVDMEERLAAMDVLARRVQNVDFALPAAAPGLPGEEIRYDAQGAWWERVLASLNDYFTLRRLEEPVPPASIALQRHSARQQMLLALEQARLALLRGGEGLYRASLARALTLGEEHIAPAAEGRGQVLEALRELRAAPVLADPPALEAPDALARALSMPLPVPAGGAGGGNDEPAAEAGQ